MEASNPTPLATSMAPSDQEVVRTSAKTTKPEKRVVKVPLYGHVWPVYPMKSRGKDIFRVFHRVNGERKRKTFMSLAEAKADAKSILKELYGKGDSQVHLTEDEKRDWQAAMAVLKQAGIRLGLETICRLYSELCALAGGAGLLTDIVRKHVASSPTQAVPVAISRLKDEYIATMEGEGRSRRYVQALKSFCGIFVREVGPDTLTNKITREVIQRFLNERKVGPRGKLNFAEAIRTMCTFGKSQRYLPEDWAEIDRITLPMVKKSTVPTYSPTELKQLLAATPDEFIPCMALAAFGGMRSAEIERISWDHIRLEVDDLNDRTINVEAGVAKTNSRRPISIHDTLAKWLNPHIKYHQRVWRGSHANFYHLQQKIAKDAGVKWRQNALRHTCISARVAITKDVPRVALESGNSVSIIKDYYFKLMLPSEAEAWFAVTPLVVHRYVEQLKEQRAKANKGEEKLHKGSSRKRKHLDKPRL